MNKIEQLQKMIDECQHIVFFGGAGVSTESGIPDFRSVDGLYHQKYPVAPEVMLSHSYFMTHTKEFFDFYREKMVALWAKPNPAHLKLAEWERCGKLSAVVTQNIDGLHTAAGCQRVYELHGSVLRNYCMDCKKAYSVYDVLESKAVPKCTCGGVIKPDVVLYEEALDDKTVRGAVKAIAGADMLIVAGTSLTVYPAAGLVDYFQGKYLVLINRDETPMDSRADLVFHENVGSVLANINRNPEKS